MKILVKILLSLALVTSGMVVAEEPTAPQDLQLPGSAPSMAELEAVSPALASYTENLVLDEVWSRDGLSPRDRSVVTVAALIARNQQVELPYHIRLALDNGVTPAEVSEIITHLAFYSGWPNAMSAVAVASDVFRERGIKRGQLPKVSPELLALDKEAEAKRQAFVKNMYGEVSPGVARLHHRGALFGFVA